jgi:hypothetical protein
MTIELRIGDAVNGYMVDGLPVCKQCASSKVPDWWQALNYDDMSDDPMHCAMCDALIFTLLSPIAADYVRNSLATNYGRPDVLSAWRQAWPAIASEAR